ncbi:hypothetical protein DY000_02009899 [Brassica cretica]|uniref:Uncharacterized protein n=1 Tax=Brassica cretica TaxID=69181 RepID=A0ABQ7C845_BRACR|nr:hypothetical protein DY000_02009899 [Brassica cretica]
MALAKELASLKLVSDVRLEEDDVLKLAFFENNAKDKRYNRHTCQVLGTIDEVPTTTTVTNLQKFMLLKFDHLQALAITFFELSDIVGQIRSVQGSDINNSAATTRLCMKGCVPIMLPRNLNQEEGLRKSYRIRSVCANTKNHTITDRNQTSIHSKKLAVSSTYILGILTLSGSRELVTLPTSFTESLQWPPTITGMLTAFFIKSRSIHHRQCSSVGP